MKHVRKVGVLILISVSLFSGSAYAEQNTGRPNVAAIENRMTQTLAPNIPSVRVMTLKVIDRGGTVIEWKLAQALEQVNGTDWMLTVMLPSSSWGQGIALLDENKPGITANEYIYLPSVRRVVRFSPLQAWLPFFGSDFTYQNFSFPKFNATTRLKGIETVDGTKAYVLQESLAQNPYYSKIDTWVAATNGLPIKRVYYDLQGKLYKSEQFGGVLVIQDIPTVTKIIMKDLQQDTSSEIIVTSVKYDKKAPQDLFNPENLAEVAASDFWKSAAQ